MTKATFKHAVALAAAATTTLILFNAVVSIAKEDKIALANARLAAATKVASVGAPRIVR